MLKYLRIRNVAVLADVEIEFRDGLNLLTGETGAGKSIVVDALGLVLGDRASSELIRSGEERAIVEAVFRVDATEPAVEALEEAGIDPSPEAPEEPAARTPGRFASDLVVRREVSGDGSRVFINGCPATVATLKRVGESLVDVHGQHQHQFLRHSRNQLEILDAYADAGDLRAKVADAYAELERLEERWDAVTEGRASIEQRLEDVRFRLEAFDALDPRAGEDEELRREAALLSHAVEIAEMVDEAHRLLEGDDTSLLARSARLEGVLDRLAGFHAELGPGRDELRSARIALADLAATLRNRVGAVDADPGRLEEVESRLSALAALARRHGGSLGAALAARQDLLLERQRLEEDLTDPETLSVELDAAAARYLEAATALSTRRRSAATRLRRAVEAELEELAMESTRFRPSVEREEGSGGRVRLDGRPVRHHSHGIDRVEFRISPNPGEAPRPLARIASGGELSRVMLALECALLGRRRPGRSPSRLVFDEVDAGIGGRVAAAVGERLRRLARERQVLCVTHLPQVASCADHHFQVEKRTQKGRTATRVRQLDPGGRVEEVARMLGGARVTAASRRHAEEMIGRSR